MADDNGDRKSTRLNSSHMSISYAVFCLKKKSFFSRRQPSGQGNKHRDGKEGRQQKQEANRAADIGTEEHFNHQKYPVRKKMQSIAPIRNAFFSNDAASPAIYTLSLHDALPI